MYIPSIKHLLLDEEFAVFSMLPGLNLHSRCHQQVSAPLRNKGDKEMPQRYAASTSAWLASSLPLNLN